MPIFRSVSDYQRFMLMLFCANGAKPIPRLERFQLVPSLAWDIENKKLDIGDPLIDMICFSLMPTHFHLLLKPLSDPNVSDYMHKLLTSYAKYFNIKHERRGHVFENRFQSRPVEDNQYLTYVSRYIHRNHSELSLKNLSEYSWSSYQDFVVKNRWGNLLKTDIILEQFKDKDEYKNYVEESLEENYPILSLA